MASEQELAAELEQLTVDRFIGMASGMLAEMSDRRYVSASHADADQPECPPAAGEVSFRWRDYRHHSENKVMTLAADEFIRRFLLHASGGRTAPR